MLAFCFAVLFVLLPTLHAAYMRIVEADVPGGLNAWRIGGNLTSKTALCPADLFPLYSVECVPRSGVDADSASFFVDGEFIRTEYKRPFVLTGDVYGEAFPWFVDSFQVNVTCFVSNSEHAFADISYSCDGEGGFELIAMPMPTVTPQPLAKPPTVMADEPTLRVIEAGVQNDNMAWSTGQTLPPIVTICPRTLFPLFTLECVPGTYSLAKNATFLVNGNIFREDRMRPFVLSGDVRGKAFPWIPESAQVEVACVLSDGGEVTSSVLFYCEESPTATTTAAGLSASFSKAPVARETSAASKNLTMFASTTYDLMPPHFGVRIAKVLVDCMSGLEARIKLLTQQIKFSVRKSLQ